MNMNRNLTRMGMKSLLKLLVILGLATSLWSQTSNVTATITDPDGQTWNNGTYTISFIPTPGNPGPFSWNGNPNFPQNYTGSLNGAGVLTVSIPDNSFIVPRGSLWQFTLCSRTSAPCQNVQLSVTGANPNLSTPLSTPLIAPRFSAGQYSFGYLDVEVNAPIINSVLAPGIVYYNVTNQIQRIWNGSAWANNSGGGSGTITGINTNAGSGLIGGGLSGTLNLSLTNTCAASQVLQWNGSGWVCSSAGTGTVTGSGASPIFPIWTGTNALGSSNLTNIPGPPAGVNYSLGSGLSWQIDANDVNFNSGCAGSCSILIQNSYAPGANNNAGGILIRGAPATGSANAGPVEILGGSTNGAGNGSSVVAGAGGSNGFGAIGGNVNITGGSTTASNSGGSIFLTPGTGGSGNGAVNISGLVNGCLNITGGVVGTTGSACGSGSGGGTVTSFSAGSLSPLFTTSVATGTTTPVLSFTLSTATQNTLFGAATSTTPAYNSVPGCSGAQNALIWTTNTGFGCNTIATGGPGTGTANSVATWVSSSTLGSIVGTVSGQTLTAVNSSAPVFASAGLADSVNSPVTSASYTIACDSSTTVIDRTHILRFQSGASTPVVPLSTATGCTGGFVTAVIDDGAGSLVFGRTSPDTFSVFNGSSASDGQTSFTLTNGQFATLTQGAPGIWEVRVGSYIYPGSGIPNSTGSAWATSYATTGSGTNVVLQTTPTINGPTMSNPTLGLASSPSAVLQNYTSSVIAPGLIVKIDPGVNDTVLAVTTSDTEAVGIVQASPPSSSNVAISGAAFCTFDSTPTAGHYVQISTTTSSNCHDAGATPPTSGSVVVGRVIDSTGNVDVRITPLAGSSSPAFSAVTSGTNLNTLAVGGVGSLVPTGVGQITGNGLFLSTGGLSGLPIPFTPSVASVASSGGGLTYNTPYFFRTTYSNGTQTSVGSEEVSLEPVNFPSSTCTASLTVCEMVITSPPAIPGVTGGTWTFYSSTSTGTEKANSACTNLSIGTNCTFTAVGTGASVPTTQSPQVLPPGTIVNDCGVNQGIPWLYGFKSDGDNHALAMFDSTTNTTQSPNGPVIGGTIHICSRTMFDDTGYNGGNLMPNSTGGRASFVNFYHYTGINSGQGCCPTGSNQDDRTISVYGDSPVGDNSTRTGAQLTMYVESGINGHPTLTDGQAITTSLASWRSNTYLDSDVPSTVFTGSMFGVDSTIEFESGTISSNTAAVHGQVSFPGTMTTGTQTEADSFFADTLGSTSTHLSIYSGFHAHNSHAFASLYNIGVNVDDYGTGNANFAIMADSVAAGSGHDYFGGPVTMEQGITGTVLPTAITAPTGGVSIAPTCVSGCTTTWTYKLVAKDAMGGWASVPLSLSTALGAATLNGSNFNTISIAGGGGKVPPTGATFGIYSYDVYRTFAGGTPSTTGYIGNFTCLLSGVACTFVDNGVAISVPTNSEPVTPPTFNTSGAGGGVTIRTTTNCQGVGTAANPSVASCSAAPAGLFSCATNASGGTCVVNTTVVTSNSAIHIEPDSSIGGVLGVTCNTTVDSGLTAPRISARTPGTSFTIALGTFTINPECFTYTIIN
jgi:hypothetical protein